MFLKSHEARRLALASAMAFAALGASSAQAAPVSLNYQCEYPFVGTQPQVITFDNDLPASAQAGVAIPPAAVDATLPVAGDTSILYRLVGAGSVSGTVNPTLNLSAPNLNLAVDASLTFPETQVPDDGLDWELSASGLTPTLTFPQPATVAVNAGKVDLNLKALDSEGNPIRLADSTGLPDSDGDPTTFDAPCTLVAGQNAKIAEIQVTGTTNLAPTISTVKGWLRANRRGVIAIKGTNLKTVTSVTIGGKAATILSKRAGRIVVNAPARPKGSQPVVVTNPNGSATTTVKYH